MTAKALILAGYGLNCEEETSFAFQHVGMRSFVRHINDLIDNPAELDEVQILAIPGGFSYGDDTGSGNAFAQKMKLALWERLKRFVERDTLTIGICNGCQIITNLGMIPARQGAYGERVLALTHNITARYGCRWVDLGVNAGNASPWLHGISRLHVPVAHGEGRFVMDQAILSALENNGQIALQYIKPLTPSLSRGERVSEPQAKTGEGSFDLANGEFPYNPNGSTADIAGVTDPSGRVLALMPHPERGMFTWQRDDYDYLKDRAQREGKTLPEEADGLALFRNASAYFEVNIKVAI